MKFSSRKAFTIIELLVVVFIISLMAGMVIVYVNTARQKAHDSQRKVDLDMVQVAIEGWAGKHNGIYPQTFIAGESEVFLNSIDNPADWAPGLTPGYINSLPKDPKGSSNNPQYIYQYASDGNDYKLEVVVMESDTGKKWATEDGGNDNNKYELFSGRGLSWLGPSQAQLRISLQFDGLDDYLEVADSSSLDVEYITMAAWIYLNPFPEGDTSPPAPKYIILEKRGDAGTYDNSSYFMGVIHEKTGSSELNRLIVGLAYNNGMSAFSKASDLQIPLKKWTHVAATYNGSQMILYINGVSSGSMSRSGRITRTSGKLFLGRNNPLLPQQNFQFFNGRMDDIRIYNSALGQVAIQQIMQDAENYLEVLHLRFDEGIGNFVQDSSGNNNNGQIFGAQW